ncbi:hypothetical protein [Corallococcus llansteffanensis]|uniref:Uncharacterized protein n=1 Tax=Corallococcus llansteffanensis TaxID=2316731 RepID=A0A3A8P4X7_9BACT|nr:hypothetical protein [Corallococcus llansteffanensis]RKH51566.1 hypothetical protein D7V93_29065 [Corallococcus llansteffanensis]
MNSFKTCSLAVVAIALGACGPAPVENGSTPDESGVAQVESAVTKAIPGTTCVVEATTPYKYDNGTMSAQASVWDCEQDYAVIYVCSTLEKRSVSSTGTVTWTAVPGSRSCYGETNTDFGGQTANATPYVPGVYRQRAQAAIKLSPTTWTPSQPSTCGTLSSDVPCNFTAVVSGNVTL